jgi:hypothetical protein
MGNNMHMTPIVYVFTSGTSNALGFSLQELGADLASACSYLESWCRAYEVEMSDAALSVFHIDTAAAISDLGSCGYHVARPTADALALPQHHRPYS